MRIDGMIKQVSAAIAAGGADVTQTIKLEVFGSWKDLRDMMQKPLEITLEVKQMELGGQHPLADHAVDAQVSRNGKRKGRGKELLSL